MATETRHIEVWYDDTSDPDEPLWCVSLCEPDGEEVKCLSTYEYRVDATAAAKRVAAKRGIEAWFRDEGGATDIL